MSLFVVNNFPDFFKKNSRDIFPEEKISRGKNAQGNPPGLVVEVLKMEDYCNFSRAKFFQSKNFPELNFPGVTARQKYDPFLIYL